MKKVKLLMSLSSATVVLTAVSIGTTSCSNLSLEQSKSEKANSYAYHDSLSFDFEIEEEIMHTFKINTASGGTVSIKKDNRVIGDTRGKEFNKKFAIGTVLQIITTPAIGYKFANWSDESLVKTDKNGYTITVGENDISLIANFTPADKPNAETVKKFTLAIPQTKNVHLYRVNNEIKLSPYSFSFKDGEKVKIEARTNDEYTFKQWSDGSTENPRIITMSENRTLFAVTNKNTEYKEIKWDDLRHQAKA